jgi:hypothetical protein
MKNVEAAPSTAATTRIAQNVTSPATSASANAPIATTRTASAAIMSRLRLQRSAASPAMSEKNAYGATRAKPTRPAFAGECVTASVSSG